MEDLSRRTFLQGTLVGGASLASVGVLAACSPTSESGGDGTPSSGGGITVDGQLIEPPRVKLLSHPASSY